MESAPQSQPFDPRVWPGFEKFNHVQAILDHNRLLINEINKNHEERNPEGLMRNVALIRELNHNVAKGETGKDVAEEDVRRILELIVEHLAARVPHPCARHSSSTVASQIFQPPTSLPLIRISFPVVVAYLACLSDGPK
eukprot:jgi/Mesen1/10150/ME000076S09659